MASTLLVLWFFFIFLSWGSVLCSSQTQNTIHVQGLALASTFDHQLPCLQKFLLCQGVLKPSATTPALCCWPFVEMVATDSRCVCTLFRETEILQSRNFTFDHVLDLLKACDAELNISTCSQVSLSALDDSKKSQSLPIETSFKLPAPLPTWPRGVGFASGLIDLGGLQVRQITSFNKIWMTYEGGPDNIGATFFEPSAIPEGFFLLGSYVQANNKPLHGWVLVGKDVILSKANATLTRPIDYLLVYTSESTGIKQDRNGYIWLPIAPDGYEAVGYVITVTPEKPSIDKVMCVRSDFTEQVETESWIWNQGGVNIYDVRPRNRGPHDAGVRVGTFAAQNSGDTNLSVACLKNVISNFSAMANEKQIESLIRAYAPFVYLHPDEEYLPSSVDWFFNNGALLYKKGEESDPMKIDPTGSNLPQGGSNDGTYWLDFTSNDENKERVKKGDLQSCKAYVHIKPMLGATFTDIAFWLFYPFNGAAKARVKFVNIQLKRLGEHVGDWEHVTLRVSNFNGELWRVYYSQHSHGTWVDASELEYQNGGRVVVYSSWHGHAAYPHPGLVLQGQDGIGVRNDADKSNMVLDTGVSFELVSANYLRSAIAEPAWLNYFREWGPKISYNIADEIKSMEKSLPGFLKFAVRNIASKLPDEVLGEEGPLGPKMKGSWDGDEV